MENNDLVKKIEESFHELHSQSSSNTLKTEIYNIVRTINRLQTQDKSLNLELLKIAQDLKSLYENQVNYSELRNKSENPGLKVKPNFDESFFKSLSILKTELFKALEKL